MAKLTEISTAYSLRSCAVLMCGFYPHWVEDLPPIGEVETVMEMESNVHME